MTIYEIRNAETSELIEEHETGAAAGARAGELNEEYRAAGKATRVRVVRAERQTEAAGEGEAIALGENGSVDLPSPDYSIDRLENYWSVSLGFTTYRIPASGVEWRNRELRKRRPFPWMHSGWWIGSSHSVLHYPYPSRKNPAKLAYTPSEEFGRDDRQLVTTPGRYLTKYFSDVLTAEEIQELALAWANTFSPRELHFATTPDEIQEVYENGPDSCMAYEESYYSSPVHPVRVYGAGDIQLAYILDCDGDITGRALVYPEKSVYGNVYGDIERMEHALQLAGYKQGGSGSFDGARLLRIEASPGVFVMPYLDYPLAAVMDNGTTLVVHSYGDISGTRTDGLSDPMTRCAACEDAVDENDCWSDPNSGESYCFVCFNERFISCPDCYEYVSLNDATVGPDGYHRCTYCHNERFTDCYACGEAADRDELHEGPDGEERCGDCHSEEVTYCEECNDAVLISDAIERDDYGYTCPDCVPDPMKCTCELNRERARAEAEAATSPFLPNQEFAFTLADTENEERIQAAIDAVPPCDRCREESGQLLLIELAPRLPAPNYATAQ